MVNKDDFECPLGLPCSHCEKCYWLGEDGQCLILTDEGRIKGLRDREQLEMSEDES